MFVGTSCWQQDIQRKEYGMAFLQATGLVVALAYLFYDSLLAVFALIPLAAAYLYQWRKERCREKEMQFRAQFKDAMQMLASSLRTGYSVENAIREAEKELRPVYPQCCRIREEFERMVHRLDMNMTVEQVMRDFARRVNQEDAKHFAEVFSISKRTGGDSISILKSSVRTIGDKIEVERQIQTMLAAKNLEFKIMCVIPLGMVLYMRVAFPEFLAVLYGTLPGVLLMSVCLVIYVFAYWLGKRMIRIEM